MGHGKVKGGLAGLVQTTHSFGKKCPQGLVCPRTHANSVSVKRTGVGLGGFEGMVLGPWPREHGFSQMEQKMELYFSVTSMGTGLVETRKVHIRALSPGWYAQWIECRPVNQRVAGSIPSWGTCLGCGPGPQWGTCGRQPHIDVSVPLFLLPFPSL